MNGTYHFDFNNHTDDINKAVLDQENFKPIRYYQWIHLIILAQIALFTLPSMVWNFFMYLNGFDMIHVTTNVIKSVYLNEYSVKENWVIIISAFLYLMKLPT